MEPPLPFGLGEQLLQALGPAPEEAGQHGQLGPGSRSCRAAACSRAIWPPWALNSTSRWNPAAASCWPTAPTRSAHQVGRQAQGAGEAQVLRRKPDALQRQSPDRQLLGRAAPAPLPPAARRTGRRCRGAAGGRAARRRRRARPRCCRDGPRPLQLRPAEAGQASIATQAPWADGGRASGGWFVQCEALVLRSGRRWPEPATPRRVAPESRPAPRAAGEGTARRRPRSASPPRCC